MYRVYFDTVDQRIIGWPETDKGLLAYVPSGSYAYDEKPFVFSGAIYSWLKSRGFDMKDWPQYTDSQTKHIFYVDFDDANLAMLFKLTWGGQ